MLEVASSGSGSAVAKGYGETSAMLVSVALTV